MSWTKSLATQTWALGSGALSAAKGFGKVSLAIGKALMGVSKLNKIYELGLTAMYHYAMGNHGKARVAMEYQHVLRKSLNASQLKGVKILETINAKLATGGGRILLWVAPFSAILATTALIAMGIAKLMGADKKYLEQVNLRHEANIKIARMSDENHKRKVALYTKEIIASKLTEEQIVALHEKTVARLLVANDELTNAKNDSEREILEAVTFNISTQLVALGRLHKARQKLVEHNFPQIPPDILAFREYVSTQQYIISNLHDESEQKKIVSG